MKIKIDGKTLRRNPQEPYMSEYMPGEKKLTMTFLNASDKFRKYLEKHEDVIWLNTDFSCNAKKEAERYDTWLVSSNKAFKELQTVAKKNKERIYNFSLEREIIDVTRLWQGEFLYDYTNPKVQCNECEASFKYRQLKTTTVYDDDLWNVCPFCSKAECVDLDFEEPEEYLKRTGKEKNEIPYANR